MNFNLNYIRAFIIMLKAHWHQKDKGGNIYIYHPIRVSKAVDSLDTKIVALLHDVLEDSTYIYYRKAFFPV